MATTNIVQALIGLALVISGVVGGNVADYYTSETKVCTNGNWLTTENAYKYKCSITEEERLCYKLSSTKKTCYLLDEKALQSVSEKTKKDCEYRPKSYCCGINGCEEILWQ